MNIEVMFIFVIVIVFMVMQCNSQENFYYKSPPLSYDANTCERMCDNTAGCNSHYYDPVTRQCFMNSYYKYGDMYYPYVNATQTWYPSKFRWGKYFGSTNGENRPLTARAIAEKKI